MKITNTLMRLKLPENGKWSSPDEQNKEVIKEKKTNRPENELDRIAARKTIGKEKDLTIKEKLEVVSLKQQERSVREHERAHLRSARNLAISQPTFEYKEGPDGEKYVVHGEVKIDSTSVDGDAEEVLEKARKIQNTALAPADPSSKDLQVAARARILESKAQRKLNREKLTNSDNHLPPGLNAYATARDYQENLYKILELFA
jgi:hypothetical protein